MKRFIGLGIVIALLVGALALSQWRKPHADVGPDSVLHLIGDTEQELSRLPMSATRLSDADEIRIGNELAERSKYMEALADNSDENKQYRRYIETVGANVATRAQRKLSYKFHYIPDPNFINAFALPGGHVYIGKGLLDLMDSEDELASILGHEVEHIDRRHAVERLQVQAQLRHLGLLRLLAELPLDLFQAGYSKEQELEADREGTRLSVMSGYSPTGTIRMFEAFDRRFHEAEVQAKSPQEETARIVFATMIGYFRSHPATQERIAQIKSLMTQENWTAKPEMPFQLSYLLWTDRAQKALQQHRYKEASGLASRALTEKPQFETALRIQGDAEYYQANFRQAANAYRELLEIHPDNPGYVEYFAFLLAASDRHTATTIFEQWMGTGTPSYTATDSLAGLQLIGGKPTAADHIYSELKSVPGDSHTPDRLAWLGWWYYVSGNSARAFDMLENAMQQRPGNPVYLVNFAWTAIEQRRFQHALSTLQAASNMVPNYSHSSTNERGRTTVDASVIAEISMATAVANWLAENRDQALGNYQTAVDHEPAWKNPAWYSPQYSPTVSHAIAEMKAEADRRKKCADGRPRSSVGCEAPDVAQATHD